MIQWDRYPNFSEKEMACKGLNCCGGKADMSPDFMLTLQALRSAAAMPLRVTSGYRCHEHNTAVGGGPAHVLGRAADIAVSRGDALRVVKLALLHGFSGLGIKQHGDNRFIHLDNLTDRECVPRPTIWSYT